MRRHRALRYSAARFLFGRFSRQGESPSSFFLTLEDYFFVFAFSGGFLRLCGLEFFSDYRRWNAQFIGTLVTLFEPMNGINCNFLMLDFLIEIGRKY